MRPARILIAATGALLLATGAGEVAARWALRDVSTGDAEDGYLTRRWREATSRRGAEERTAPDVGGPERRIAVIGDAVTAGRGLVPEAGFGAALEQILRDLGAPARVERYPVPAGGDPLMVLERVLAGSESGRAVHGRPDLVLWQWSAFDPSAAQPRTSWLARRSALATLAALGWREARAALDPADDPRAGTVERFREADGRAARAEATAIGGFFERCARAGVPAGMVLFPDLDEGLLFDHPLGFRVERVLERCRAVRGSCLDLRAAFAVVGPVRQLRLNAFDRHPGPRAHRIAAGEVALHFAQPLGLFALAPDPATQTKVALWGLFETALRHPGRRANAYAELSLEAAFLSPGGRLVRWFGFYDGPSSAGGSQWRQRFMPDEVGTWRYVLGFDADGPWRVGSFECVAEGARPGPWRPDRQRPRWLRDARGEPFLPTAFFANAAFTPADWRQAIAWAKARGYNTLVTPTLNAKTWGAGWENVTPFATRDAVRRQVDYTRPNLRAWREWDALLREAGEAAVYVGPFEGPAGDYGGQSGVGTVVPPPGLEYGPPLRTRFDDPRNLRVMRTLVARQGAFWNLAYWNLYSTEIHEIKDREEVIRYFETLAAWTPFGRMLTAQDVEQGGRQWLSEADIPIERKLETFQLGTIDDESTQRAGPNNRAALEAFHGFPVLATESLWEGQPRANRPLRVIWGALTAGMHTVWADWSYDDGIDGGRWGSMGRGWTPLRPLDESVFGLDELGADTVGDEELPIATGVMRELAWWRLDPHNELVAGGGEAYALAEPGAQYLVYAPAGGEVSLDLRGVAGALRARWIDPATGRREPAFRLAGGEVVRLGAPGTGDRVLLADRFADPSAPERGPDPGGGDRM